MNMFTQTNREERTLFEDIHVNMIDSICIKRLLNKNR